MKHLIYHPFLSSAPVRPGRGRRRGWAGRGPVGVEQRVLRVRGALRPHPAGRALHPRADGTHHQRAEGARGGTGGGGAGEVSGGRRERRDV